MQRALGSAEADSIKIMTAFPEQGGKLHQARYDIMRRGLRLDYLQCLGNQRTVRSQARRLAVLVLVVQHELGGTCAESLNK